MRSKNFPNSKERWCSERRARSSALVVKETKNELGNNHFFAHHPCCHSASRETATVVATRATDTPTSATGRCHARTSVQWAEAKNVAILSVRFDDVGGSGDNFLFLVFAGCGRYSQIPLFHTLIPRHQLVRA